MLERDVNNMRETFGRAAPELLETQYALEIWKLYEAGELTPDSALTGRFERDSSAPDVDAVLSQIEDERREAEARERRRVQADAA
jgi:RIO kinase 1